MEWERGFNENANELIKQHLPKSKRLNKITNDKHQSIMHNLNHIPSKSRGFKTPHEAFCKRKTLLNFSITGDQSSD